MQNSVNQSSGGLFRVALGGVETRRGGQQTKQANNSHTYGRLDCISSLFFRVVGVHARVEGPSLFVEEAAGSTQGAKHIHYTSRCGKPLQHSLVLMKNIILCIILCAG